MTKIVKGSKKRRLSLSKPAPGFDRLNPRCLVWLLLIGITSCTGQPTLPVSPSPIPETNPTETIPTTSTPLSAGLVGDTTPQSPHTPTPSPLPLITSSPVPSPQLLQLTSGGCCVQPFFSPDSAVILFLDKPAPDTPTGLWGVPLAGGNADLHTEKLGIYSPDMQFVAYPEGGQTIVERISDAQRWTVPNGGRSLTFSPSGGQVAWTAGQAGPPFDTALREIWISAFDGSGARQVASLIGGGLTGWVSETQALVTGRQTLDESDRALWALSLEDGTVRELVRGGRIRSISISPGGTWLAYLVTFSTDPAQSGIWLQNMVSGERKKLDLFGGYRWRDEDRLLVIPLDPDAARGLIPSHQLWEVDAVTGQSHPLTDPAILPFKVAEGDWTVSPDGQHVVFVSATDRNIWVLTIQP